MRRPGTRAAHAGADAGHAGPRRTVRGVPRTIVPLVGDLAAGAGPSSGLGEPVLVGADSSQPGGGACACLRALGALGAGGRGSSRAGGGHAATVAERQTGQPGAAYGKRIAGSATGGGGVRTVHRETLGGGGARSGALFFAAGGGIPREADAARFGDCGVEGRGGEQPVQHLLTNGVGWAVQTETADPSGMVIECES